ncbi:hypothetical protein ACLOJK_037422 [Asimina triloba]
MTSASPEQWQRPNSDVPCFLSMADANDWWASDRTVADQNPSCNDHGAEIWQISHGRTSQAARVPASSPSGSNQRPPVGQRSDGSRSPPEAAPSDHDPNQTPAVATHPAPLP